MRKVFKIFGYSFLFLLFVILLCLAYIQWGLSPELPNIQNQSSLQFERKAFADSLYKVNGNWLKRNNAGWWEEYVSGEPFERGVVLGKLNKELMHQQEAAFVNQINELVPSKSYLKFLGFFTKVFNRNLDKNIPQEYKDEIYGESLSAPDGFNYIGTAYERMLNYHAAHDIGHALQSLALVGCTSFAAWDEFSVDSQLVIGRNFDFYVGDEFARNKIVLFMKPTKGNNFAMITWPGMIGCTSGMNEKGLTVTLNAAKSDIPKGSATPISILAREILQYASTIDEAYSIAKKRKTFVSESLMIGSASERKVALIEKSPTKTALYFSGKNYLLCANHYQSDTFKNDANNMANIKESASMYRYTRLNELVNDAQKLDVKNAVAILRDQKGQNGKDIGIGNEKALNQLIVHHAVVFKPEELKFWVSTSPYQLGKFVCYDLNKVFAEAANVNSNQVLYDTLYTIAADSFVYSAEWKNFLAYRDMKNEIKKALKVESSLLTKTFDASKIVSLNPEYWESHYWAAEYYNHIGDKKKAISYYRSALQKEVNDLKEVRLMESKIKELTTKK
jgi:isopenicillin-N N-acyltransferase like protein